MNDRNNKFWRRLDTVSCASCDYLYMFEGSDDWFCANNNRKSTSPEIIDIFKKKICKHYFPSDKPIEKGEENG